MSITPIAISQTQLSYISVLGLTVPPEGPRSVPLPLDFTKTNQYQLNLQNMVSRNFISMIQALWVDNSQNPATLTISLPQTGQNIIFEPGEQGYVNVLSPNPPIINFLSTGNVAGVFVELLNYPVTNAVWQTGLQAFTQQSQCVTYSGGLIEPDLVPNYTLTSPQGVVLTIGVTSGQAGSGYVVNDTGLISGAGDGLAEYKVTAIQPQVITVSATGGTGYSNGDAATSVVTGTGDGTLRLTVVEAGGIVSSATVTSGHAGNNYHVGDTGTISGGSGTATYTVLTVTANGAVETLSLVYGGNNYSNGTGYTTTALIGAGTGLQISVLTSGATGITASVSPLLTPTTGYYVGGFAVFLTSNSTLTAGTDLQVSLVDSVSGVIGTVNLSPVNGIFAGSLGFFWNNKTAGSVLSLTLSTTLSGGELFYTVPYGLSGWVG